MFKKSKKSEEDLSSVEEKIRKQLMEEEKPYDEDKKKSKDQLFSDLFDDIVTEFILNKPTFINAVERGLIKKEDLKTEIYKFIDTKTNNLIQEEKNILLRRFETYVWGYGELQPLIDNVNVTDIKTIDFDNIRIKSNGKRKTSDVKFEDRERLKQYVNYIAIKNGVTLSEINAVQRFTDKTSNSKFVLRIDISSEFVNSVEYPYLTIRKIPKYKYTLEKLQGLNMINEDMSQYLKSIMKSGISIMTTGKGASGKTTMLNALLDEIPHDKSGLVIQEAEELYSKTHPDIMFQKVRSAIGESKIEYTLKDLSINGLLTDIDFFCIGEIKGPEAFDMINATYTGASGLCSVHGNSAIESIEKMIHYMKYSSDMKRSELLKMLSSLDVICFMRDFKVVEIVEIAGYDEKKQDLIYNTVFKYEISKREDGKLIGSFKKVNDSCKKINDKIEYNKFIKENQ